MGTVKYDYIMWVLKNRLWVTYVIYPHILLSHPIVYQQIDILFAVGIKKEYFKYLHSLVPPLFDCKFKSINLLLIYFFAASKQKL